MNALLLHVFFVKLTNFVLLRGRDFVLIQILLLFHDSHKLLVLPLFGVDLFFVNIEADRDDTEPGYLGLSAIVFFFLGLGSHVLKVDFFLTRC